MATSVLLTVPLPASPEAGSTPSSGQNSPESAASPPSRENGSTVKRKKKPYKELTLEEKVRLIKMAEENNCMSQASIAERYSIAKSNVCRILQRKQEYLQAYESAGFAGTRKRKLRNDSTTAVKSTKLPEKADSEPEPDYILKPIPRKLEDPTPLSGSEPPIENPLGYSSSLESLNSQCGSSILPIAAGLSELRGETGEHRSAFRHLSSSEPVNAYTLQQALSHWLAVNGRSVSGGLAPSSYPELSLFPTMQYTDESALLQAKTLGSPTVNMILNHALLKRVESLTEKLAQYERQQCHVRSLIQNAENSGLVSSPDAVRLIHSLLALL